jgi:REP element-mobilizing transposase RayT
VDSSADSSADIFGLSAFGFLAILLPFSLCFYTFVHVKQLKLLKNEPLAYGGALLKTRAGRAHGRPLSTRETMHLVLRSTKATGALSFRCHSGRIEATLKKFSRRYGVKILSLANVGNHLHLQIKLSNRQLYKPFIRAVTAAIAMAVTGASRWKKMDGKFWDYRPFTRVVKSWRGYLTLKDYIHINRLEGAGVNRPTARFILARARDRFG